MDIILNTTILGLIFGTLGTTLGGIIGVSIKTNSNKFLSFILEFAAGLMISIVCFELIPEAMELSNIFTVIVGIIIGVIIMIFCDNLVNYKYSKKAAFKMNSLIKTGIIVGIGLAIHNFPEGLAIGSGFSASTKLGITLAIAIALHDVPERNINGSSNEKRWNENLESSVVYFFIRSNNRSRSLFWNTCRHNIRTNDKYLFRICSRSNAIYISR